MALTISLLPEKPLVFNWLLSFLDNNIFNTSDLVFPNIPLVLKVENIINGETLEFYHNGKLAYRVVVYDNYYEWKFIPDWDVELNSVYVVGSISGKSENTIYFLPHNFAIYLWLFSEFFGRLLYEIGSLRKDFFIFDERLNWFFNDYSLSKYVLNDFIPPLKKFIDSLVPKKFLEDAYFVQVGLNRETAMLFFIIIFVYLFKPYLKFFSEQGNIFPLIWFWYDEIETFSLRFFIDRVSKEDERIYWNSNVKSRIGHKYFLGCRFDELNYLPLFEGTWMVVVDYLSNIHKVGNGSPVKLKEVPYLSFFNYENVEEVLESKKDIKGRWSGMINVNFSFKDNIPGQLTEFNMDTGEFILYKNLKLNDELKVKDWNLVIGYDVGENLIRLMRGFFNRYYPVFIYNYFIDQLGGRHLEVFFEPSLLSAGTSDVRLYSHRANADGELYVVLEDSVIADEGLKKQVVKSMKKYWEISKLVDKKFYLMLGLFNDADKNFYQNKAKPILWYLFKYVDYVI